MPTSFPILVVDDDPHIVDILRRAARNVFPQAHFLGIQSFAEAARFLSDLSGPGPRLVLLDIDLQSELDGLDFLTLLRGHPQGRLVPIIMLSANKNPLKRGEAYMRGANAVTGKPFSFEEWKSYVENLRLYWVDVATTPKLYFLSED